MKRAFIYTRVSTQDQTEGYSLGEQEERLKKYCEAMGWTASHVYCDPGFSGGNMERPALQEMISEIKKGNCDIVVVDKLDRLSRSQFDTLFLIKKVFNPNNVAFVSRAESFDTSTPFGRAMLGILAVFAELERERIRERMMEGKQGRIKEGKFQGGNRVPFGYDYDIDQGILVPNEYEAMVVNEIFEMIANRMPFKSIEKVLNDKGYVSKNKRQFSDVTIRYMASNQTYLGNQLYQGKWEDALHEPIISTEIWDKVQKVMKERDIQNDKYKPGKHYNSPLGGLIWCARCGAKYHFRKNRNIKYYACYSRTKSDPKLVKDINCKNRNYNDKLLETAVYNEVLRLKLDNKYFDKIKKSVDLSGKIEVLQKRIKEVDKQIAKCMELYVISDIDIDSIKGKAEVLSNEKKLLMLEIENLEREQQPMPKDEVLTLVDALENFIEAENTAAIHDVLMELIDYISIDGDDIQIYWNF